MVPIFTIPSKRYESHYCGRYQVWEINQWQIKFNYCSIGDNNSLQSPIIRCYINVYIFSFPLNINCIVELNYFWFCWSHENLSTNVRACNLVILWTWPPTLILKEIVPCRASQTFTLIGIIAHITPCLTPETSHISGVRSCSKRTRVVTLISISVISSNTRSTTCLATRAIKTRLSTLLTDITNINIVRWACGNTSTVKQNRGCGASITCCTSCSCKRTLCTR